MKMDRQAYLRNQTDLLIAADILKRLPLNEMMAYLGYIKVEENGKILDSYGRELPTDPDTIRRTLILAAEFTDALIGRKPPVSKAATA